MHRHVHALEGRPDGVEVGDIRPVALDALDRSPVQRPQLVAAHTLQVPPQETSDEPAHSRYKDLCHIRTLAVRLKRPEPAV